MLFLAHLKLKKSEQASIKPSDHDAPSLSVLIPVHNGESEIEAKIENCRSINWPGYLSILIVSDGSTDKTCEIVRGLSDETVRLIELADRSGKSAAQNAGMKEISSDFVLLTDVDSVIKTEALTSLLAEMNANPDVGCVGGTIHFESANVLQKTYWQIESILRKAESDLDLLVSISGAAMLIRTSAFTQLDEDTGDDMVLPLDLLIKNNLKTKYVSQVIAVDRLASKDEDILRARRRITQRNLKALVRRLPELLTQRRFALIACITSHKLLRWLSPLVLLSLIAGFFVSETTFGLKLLAILAIAIIAFKTSLAKKLALEAYGVMLGIYDFIKLKSLKHY